MPQAPKVIKVYDTSNAPIQAGSGVPVVFLVDSNDGADLNNDNVLYEISGTEEFEASIGRKVSALNAIETIESYFQIGRAKCFVGRITGAGGAKAQTAAILDFNTTAVATVLGRWRGKGVNGNLYSLRVSRGRKSTTDTGVGRVDTKIELIETATLRVLGFQDELVMDVNSSRYALNIWNSAGFPCVLVDQALADTYQNTDEPAVGTYAFSGGADAAAAVSGEYQAAVDKLAQHAETKDARVGVVGWAAADFNYLLGKSADLSWKCIAYLPEGTTTSSAATFVAAITSNLARAAVFTKWGKTTRNPNKRISGLGEVLAQMVVAARREGGKAVNSIGANEAIDIWEEFDTITPAEREGYAAARVNPLYKKVNRYQNGVVVGDALSLSNDPRYSQIGHIAGEDLVVGDLVDWLESNVNLRQEYPIQPKVGGVNTAITLDSLSRIDSNVNALMTLEYPKTLFGRTRGQSGGWDWRGDVQTDSDGTNFVFWLGLDIAGLNRISTIKIGQVAGRFAVLSAQQGG